MKKIAIAALALVVSTAAHAKFESGKSATGIRYVKLHVTAKMIIGIRESSGKEFTINLNDLYRAYQECLRLDRKRTRMNSSHTVKSYAVFCLKKKRKKNEVDEMIRRKSNEVKI